MNIREYNNKSGGKIMSKFINKFNFPSKKMVLICTIILLVSGGVLIPLMGNFVGSYTYPDNTFLLTYSKLHEYISKLGALGIERYVITKYSFDIVWPFIYVLFLNVLINYFRQFIKMEPYLNLLSAICFVFDMLENLYFASYLANHGSEFIGYIGITCYYIKWVVLFALIGILIYKFNIYVKLQRKQKDDKE